MKMIIMMRARPVLFIICSLILCLLTRATSNGDHQPRREAFQIIIGGGGGKGGFLGYDPAPPPETGSCEPPPPPPVEECPEPSPPPPSPPPPSPPPPKKCPPPPPPPKRPPQPPPSLISPRVVKAARVIKRFRKLVTVDPFHVTKTWKGDDACKYKGFTCDPVPDSDQKNAVSGVVFNGFGLGSVAGHLPLDGFINELEDLAFFHANSNNFTGTVPDINLSKIRFLYELDLSNNKLTGEFPRQVLAARNLTFLDLRFNELTGIVPPEVFTLDVQAIFINNNKFSTEIPRNLGSTPALYLTFANNLFTGPVPKSIGKLGDTLLEVLFISNKLSGCLPYEIGLLKKTTLFDIRNNKLTGPIPHSFGCLEKMEELNLSQNKLSGAIPESLCQLGLTGNLEILYASQNYFTQVGPACRKLIEKKRLDIKINCIYDLPNQRTEKECENFFKNEANSRCPEARMMTYIPCQNKWYNGNELSPVEGRELESTSSGNRRLDGVRASSVTYGALTPDSL